MNTDRAGAVALAREVAGAAPSLAGVELVVCPPFVYLDAVARALADASAPVGLGAQDLHYEKSGAFTGEVSASMLQDVGARWVLTGHSERRHLLGEPDDLVARKTRAALDAGLSCILCVGETLEQRRADQTNAVNERQVRSAFAGLAPAHLERLTIAYEPVWAIGTGQTASPADAQSAHAFLRALVAALAGPVVAGSMRILYGGSVKPDNARELCAQPDIDGGLIGGASLKASDFLAIAKAAQP